MFMLLDMSSKVRGVSVLRHAAYRQAATKPWMERPRTRLFSMALRYM